MFVEFLTLPKSIGQHNEYTGEEKTLSRIIA